VIVAVCCCAPRFYPVDGNSPDHPFLIAILIAMAGVDCRVHPIATIGLYSSARAGFLRSLKGGR
jgi:hypothetical protein